MSEPRDEVNDVAPPTSTAVTLDEITLDDRAWPRATLDHERVELFMELLQNAHDEGQKTGKVTPPLPPLAVVADGNGGFILADGRHRYEARRRLGKGFDKTHVHVHVSNGNGPVEHAYGLALMYTTVSAKPLTMNEKKAAVRRLISEHPELSNRQVARLVGVTHPTVARQKAEMEPVTAEVNGHEQPTGSSANQAKPPRREPHPEGRGLRWEIAAERLAEDVAELLSSCRRVFGGQDHKRAGRELHDALAELYGDEDALEKLDELSTLVGHAMSHAMKETVVT